MENQRLTEDVPTKITGPSDVIEDAAKWLLQHRNECFGKAIPVLKIRFGLRNIQAIEAAKRAHALEFAGAVR